MAGNSSSKPSTEAQDQDKDFVLKHRLIGAAILISFGVLFLPWMLGSYSADKSAAVAGTAEPVSLKTAADAGGFQAVDDEGNVKVFVSKIKPVKVDVPGTNKDKSVEPKKIQGSTAKLTAPSSTAKKPEAKKPVVKQVAKVEKKAPATPVVKPKPKKPVEKAVSKPASSIDQGYIVSVGVFSERKNVDAVMKDLKSKEFSPSSGLVKTKKGEATRVWLGPFATRAEAGREKSRLQQKVGERGLIIKYP